MEKLSALTNLWETLENCVIRPPRVEYGKEELLGRSNCRFGINGVSFLREDLQLVNCRGQVLECSHYKPLRRVHKELPCVIYCHCNSGCRADANDVAALLLPEGITVFVLDFSGSGLSGGEFVTLGALEIDDVEACVDHLRKEGDTSLIGLWGRSMGAVTSILYAQRDPTIAGMVLDSPFSRLTDLMLELVATHKIPIPKYAVKVAVTMMRRSVKKRAGFNISDVDPLAAAPASFTPALFGHATGDDFVAPHHSHLLHDAYAGDKNLVTFEGDHNSARPDFFYSSVSIFFHNTLHPPPAGPASPAASPSSLRARGPASLASHPSSLRVSATSQSSGLASPGVDGETLSRMLVQLTPPRNPGAAAAAREAGGMSPQSPVVATREGGVSSGHERIVARVRSPFSRPASGDIQSLLDLDDAGYSRQVLGSGAGGEDEDEDEDLQRALALSLEDARGAGAAGCGPGGVAALSPEKDKSPLGPGGKAGSGQGTAAAAAGAGAGAGAGAAKPHANGSGGGGGGGGGAGKPPESPVSTASPAQTLGSPAAAGGRGPSRALFVDVEESGGAVGAVGAGAAGAAGAGAAAGAQPCGSPLSPTTFHTPPQSWGKDGAEAAGAGAGAGARISPRTEPISPWLQAPTELDLLRKFAMTANGGADAGAGGGGGGGGGGDRGGDGGGAPMEGGAEVRPGTAPTPGGGGWEGMPGTERGDRSDSDMFIMAGKSTPRHVAWGTSASGAT